MNYQSKNYALQSDYMGNFLLVRLADCADCYFQGDDAQLWHDNLTLMQKIDRPFEDFLKAFDYLCEGYDDVLTAQGASLFAKGE